MWTATEVNILLRDVYKLINMLKGVVSADRILNMESCAQSILGFEHLPVPRFECLAEIQKFGFAQHTAILEKFEGLEKRISDFNVVLKDAETVFKRMSSV
jgi:hypothetical protein